MNRRFPWRSQLCGRFKILLDWAENGSVLVVASLGRVPPTAERFQWLRVFQELEIPVGHAPESAFVHPWTQRCSGCSDLLRLFGLGCAARAVSKVTSEKDPTDGWTIGSNNNVVVDTQGRTR
jgi:hypothetical protein